jgi:hypothetical protein
MHNNYFLQVQTLINQKAIEAPGEKKRKQSGNSVTSFNNPTSINNYHIPARS